MDGVALTEQVDVGTVDEVLTIGAVLISLETITASGPHGAVDAVLMFGVVSDLAAIAVRILTYRSIKIKDEINKLSGYFILIFLKN